MGLTSVQWTASLSFSVATSHCLGCDCACTSTPFHALTPLHWGFVLVVDTHSCHLLATTPLPLLVGPSSISMYGSSPAAASSPPLQLPPYKLGEAKILHFEATVTDPDR
jgi:hypothetical protein